jgi:uncharacterized protein
VPPHGHIGAIPPEARVAIRAASPVGTKYDTVLDRESAYEKLHVAAVAAGVSATPAAATTPVAAAAVGAPVPPGNYPTAPAPAPASTGYPAGVPVPGAAAPAAGGYPAGVPAPGGAAAMGAPPARGGANEAAAAMATVAGGLIAAFGKSALRSMGTQVGRSVSRGLLGGIGGGLRR